jgi:hypothetical protein
MKAFSTARLDDSSLNTSVVGTEVSALAAVSMSREVTRVAAFTNRECDW